MKPWWIDEHKLLGSSNPTIDQLIELHQEGFRNIISLLEEHEQHPNYDIMAAKVIGFKRHNIPLMDFHAPTLEKIQEFLEMVNQALNQGKILVHCQGGSGRTGTMGAAYWMSKGLTAEEAIKKVRQSNPKAIENHEQENSLHKFDSWVAFSDPKSLEAVCLDFRGVIVDHRNDKDLILGMDKLLKGLKDRGLRLAIVSSFPSQFVMDRLGTLQGYFDDDIFSGSGKEKLDHIKKFAEKYSICDLSKVAFIDDKPENLLAVAQHSRVYVIAFRGSGKYPHILNICKERKIPFAETIEVLEKLLSI